MKSLRVSRTVFSFVLLLSTMIASAAAAQKKVTDDITISAVGDMMLGNDYPENNLPPNDGARIFEDSKEYIQAADIRFGNLEGTLFDGQKGRGSKAEGANRYLFRSPTRFVERLREAGFNVVSLANNHVMDFGPDGFDSTKKTLATAGIQFSSKDGEIATFQVKGARVAVIAGDYYSGARSITRPESFLNEIQALSEQYDIVIVSLHAGAEGAQATHLNFANEIFHGENRGNPVAFARDAVERGADLILMHGPHVPRAMEIHQGRLIAYSLGNFATMQGMSVKGINGWAPLLRVQLARNGEFLRGHIASFQQQRPDRVIYDKNENALKTIQKLSLEQFPKTSPLFLERGFIGPR